MKTIRAISLLVVLVVATGFTVEATSQANQNRDTMRALAAQRALLAAVSTRLEARSAAATTALANLEQKEAGAADKAKEESGAAPASQSSTKPPTNRRPSFQALDAIIGRDPQKAAELVRLWGETWECQVGSIYEALGLSAEQIAQVKAIAMAAMGRRMDVAGALAVQGLDADGNDAKALRGQLLSNHPLADVLGDKYALWKEYMIRRPIVSMIVRDVAGSAIYTGEPMTAAQVEQAAQILAANSTGRVAFLSNPTVDASINWSAARSQLAGVLSPTQIATLADSIDYSLANRKMNTRENQLTAEFKRRQGGR